MSDKATLANLRDKARALAERTRSDPAYLQRIKEDPIGTLSGAGIPEGVINQLVEAKTADVEVAGYRWRDEHCNDGTCWSSNCAECCYITF